MSGARQIGEYRIIAALGSGGMARVYLGMSEKSGFTKLLVLKVLRSELDDPSFVEMFHKEARLAARLNHPHVVQTNSFGEDEGRHYMAMEYLEGQSLSSLLKVMRNKGGVPLDLHVRILCDLLEGLDYAHKLADFDGTPLSIVHRDVSPQNVFVTYTGQSKVLDFGIAKVSDSPRTSTGVIKGKVAYMAPEQIKGQDLDGRADVFAVGVMLWEAIANRRLVKAGTEDVAVLARRNDGLDPKIRDVAPDAPAMLADICDRAMAHAPSDRYASAADMRDALEEWLKTLPNKPEPRQIAALLEREFAEERTRLRKLVDDKIKNVDATDAVVDLAKFHQLSSRSGNTGAGSSADDVPTTLGATPPRKSKARFALLAVVAVVGIAGAATVRTLFVPSHDTKPSASAEAPKPSAAPAGAPKMIELRLDATPHEARILLDGKALTSNPFSGSFPADDVSHELRIEADGYATETRRIALSADLNVILALEKAPQPLASASVKLPVAGPLGGPRPPPVTPSATASAAHPVSPPASASAKPKGPLDWKDPWQQ
jgi:serine/threonine-protein kinase